MPEVLEGSLMLASHSLLLLGVPLNRVLARIRAIREERYSLFRGFFHGASDAADAADNLQPRLHSVLLTERARRSARRCRELELDGIVEVTGVRRRARRSQRPGPDAGSRPATSSCCSAGRRSWRSPRTAPAQGLSDRTARGRTAER